MSSKLIVRCALVLLAVGVCSASVFAQAGELYLYGGGYWPSGTDKYGDFKNEGIYGLKAGAFLNPNFELEGSFGYLNHFEQKTRVPNVTSAGTLFSPSVMGFLYDVNGAYNFGQRNLFGARVSPYFSLGVGGLTTEVKHADSTFLAGGFTTTPAGAIVAIPGRSVALNDGDTFFTVNYGGGIKAMRLWGPVGLRADIRGRTIPNFFGETLNWPELTGGVTFAWGER
jgi:Outer membrane protein beta-barrel domain